MGGVEGRIYVVDDDAAVRDSLQALLSAEGFESEACASPAEFLARFDPTGAACVLLDVHMPGMDGLTLLETLGSDRQGVPVIILTGSGGIPMAVRAIRAGASDFVQKPFVAARLLESIRSAIARGQPSRAAADPAVQVKIARLTSTERQVMEQMISGLPNELIARRLGMPPHVVDGHRDSVMHKTGASGLSHLVRIAVRAGLHRGAGERLTSSAPFAGGKPDLDRHGYGRLNPGRPGAVERRGPSGPR